MAEEIIDVPDEVQAKPYDAAADAAKASVSNSDKIAVQPEPGSLLNDMQSKLDKAMSEVIEREKHEKQKSAEKPEEKKEEKPEEKKEPEAKKEEAPKEPDTFTSAKAADWKKLKEARQAAEAKASELEKKLLAQEVEFTQLKSRVSSEDKIPEFTKQVDELKSEREKLISKIEALDLEKSPRFSEHYQKAFDQAATRAKESVGPENAEKVEQLLQLPPSKWRKERLNEIRETLSGIDVGQFDIALAEWDRARSDKESALANAKENHTKLRALQAEEANRSAELSKARIDSTVNRALQMAEKFDAFKAKDGDEEHNKEVARNRDRVGKFFKMELPVEELSLMPIVAAEGQRLMNKEIPALKAKIAELEEALSATKGAQPSIGGGGKTGDTGQKKSFSEVFAENWKGPQ